MRLENLAPFSLRALAGDTVEAARALVGAVFVSQLGPTIRAGRIVETEAYTQDDPASHSYRGATARNAAMFGPPGCLYVYRSYGVHWCANVVTEPDGRGAAVLLRSLEPLAGMDAMAAARGVEAEDLLALCSGPGKLAQAFGITIAHNGVPLLDTQGPLALFAAPEALPATMVETRTRIGIAKGKELPRRFVLRGSRFLSRP